MNCLYFLLLFLHTTTSLNDLFLLESPLKPSKPYAAKSSSLANLLRHIATNYLQGCILSIVYDANFEHESHPIDFQEYFSDTGLSFTQELVDFSGKPREKKSDRCINYVVFLYNIQAMKHIMGQNVKSKIVVVSGETPWEVKDFLKGHLSRAYKNLLVIARSTSRRNGDGSYLLYTHHLYAEGSGSAQPFLLASWINNSVSVDGIDLFPDKLKRGFMGHRMLVSTAENPPFTIRRGGSKWDGLEIRMLHLAAEYLNFTIDFAEPKSPALSPNEAVKMDVLQGLAAAAAGGLYQTDDQVELFEATLPFTEDCASFISLASTALPKYRAILGPFQLTVWLLLCLAYFVVIIPLSFNSKYTIISLIKHPGQLNNMFWFVFSTYTNSFVVKSPLLDYGIAKNAITLLLGMYWVFTIIITSCYTGSIVAFITLPVFPSAIETAEELLAYRYRIGTLDHNGWEKWFSANSTDDPFLRRLFRKIEYVPTVLEGVQNASRAYFWPYAFLASRTSLDYIIQTDFAPTWTTKRTLMHVSDECFVRYNVVQLFAAKSLYTEPMNGFVTRAMQTGLIAGLMRDIDREVQRDAMKKKKQVTKGMSRKISVEDRTLTVEDTEGMFLILGSGVLMALLALSLESIYNCIERRKLNEDNESEMDTTPWPEGCDSWVTRELAFPGIKQRSMRGSV